MPDNNVKRDPSLDIANMFNDTETQPPSQTTSSPEPISDGIIISNSGSSHPYDDGGAEVIDNLKSEASAKTRHIVDAISRGEDPFNEDGVALNDNDTYNSLIKTEGKFSEHAVAIKSIEDMSNEYIQTPGGVYPKNHPKAKEYMTALATIKNKVNNPQTEQSDIDSEDEIGEPIDMSVENTDTIEMPEQSEETQKEEVMSFNVPAESASEFISTMSAEDKNKLERTKKIQVNEVVMVDVPVATRKIRNIGEYKKVIPKLGNAETIDAVLVNSGYIATFKGCGSFKLASILADNGYIDYNKRYTFCYQQLVDTSIGKLSYQEFVTKTSVLDMDECLRAILRAGCVDEDEVIIQCSVCQSEYKVNFTYSSLIDIDTMPEDTKIQMDKIMSSRYSLDEAKAVQEESPVMTSKIIKVSDSITISLKCPNGITGIAYYTKKSDIEKQYNPLVSVFLLYIDRLWLTENDKNGDPQVYLIDNIDVIADIIYNMSDTELEVVRLAAIDMNTVSPFTYSFKGDFDCPGCGKHEKNIPCKIDDLVFQMVQKRII